MDQAALKDKEVFWYFRKCGTDADLDSIDSDTGVSFLGSTSGDQEEDASSRVFSRWEFSIDAGGGKAQAYSRDERGLKAVFKEGQDRGIGKGISNCLD